MDQLGKAQEQGVVLGLKKVAGVVPRLDIDVLLFKEPEVFNLFLLAFEDLKTDKNIMGYFQIAGIHGLPKAFWNGVGSDKKTKGRGYCAHSTPTFPTWHRPYLAMIEQSIYLRMARIAEKFPDDVKQMYRDKVSKFRFPYWDYFRPRAKGETKFPGITLPFGKTSFPYDFSIPRIFTEPKVMIRTPEKNELVLRENPLFNFSFPKDAIPDDDWKVLDNKSRPNDPQSSNFDHHKTERYPKEWIQDQAKDPLTALNQALNAMREPLTDYSLNMMNWYDKYSDFASNVGYSEGFDDKANTVSASGSIEGIHGEYHGLIGGTAGHMSRVPVAAFDPVFWFHHCQIDRWAAIWQAVKPDKWFKPGEKPSPPPPKSGEKPPPPPPPPEIYETSDLLPFRTKNSSDPQTFWNSAASKDEPRSSRFVETFGYTYPDLQAEQVLATFTKNYQWSTRSAGKDKFGNVKPPPDMEPLPLSNAQVYKGLEQSLAKSATGAFRTAQSVLVSGVETMKDATLGSDSDNAAIPEQEVMAEESPLAESLPTPQAPVPAPDTVDESAGSRQWFVDHIVERLALDGAFTIYYFIGNFEDQPLGYILEPALAGMAHNFAAPTEACDNCGRQEEQGHVVTDTAPITPILKDYVGIGELQSLAPEHVKPFLIKRLKWRVTTVNGDRVDPRTVRQLKFRVTSVLTPGPESAGPPLYEEYQEIIQEIISNSS